MKKKFSLVLLIEAFIVSAAFVANAQNGAKAEVKSIDAYCKTVDAIRTRSKLPSSIFADTSDIDVTKPKWRAFSSEKALEDFREDSETYTIAYNWRNRGKIVASNFTHFSPSGDWVKYVYHCFRANGTLARVETDYRTFKGDFKVVRKRYFDRFARRINMSVKYLDLQTDKPKNADSGVLGDDGNEVDYYLKTSKLPFGRLLKK